MTVRVKTLCVTHIIHSCAWQRSLPLGLTKEPKHAPRFPDNESHHSAVDLEKAEEASPIMPPELQYLVLQGWSNTVPSHMIALSLTVSTSKLIPDMLLQ